MSSVKLLAVFFPFALTFAIGLLLQPIISKFLYHTRMFKRAVRDQENSSQMSAEYSRIHNHESERQTPRIGGVLVWLSVIVAMIIMVLIQTLAPSEVTFALDFTSRSQTLIPFVVLVIMSLIGLADDLMQILATSERYIHGFSRKTFAAIVTAMGLIGGVWMYVKLDITAIHIPGMGAVAIGWLIIPLFIIVSLAVFSSGVIDGVDGLAGGVMAIIFASYGALSIVSNRLDLAGLCFAISGATLAFVWFNVPPAKFYLGETGMLGLTSTLTYIAFLTDTVIWLPLIAFPLALTTFSSATQIISKKYFKRKIFRVAPIHHHFESIGWSRPAIVMRYWIITLITGSLGVLLALVVI
jgi:phospho-N-acetylmuramoyl-pentapeptide-transferase